MRGCHLCKEIELAEFGRCQLAEGVPRGCSSLSPDRAQILRRTGFFWFSLPTSTFKLQRLHRSLYNRYTQYIAVDPSIFKQHWKLSALAWEETTKKLPLHAGRFWIISPRVSCICCEVAVRDEMGSCQTIPAL